MENNIILAVLAFISFFTLGIALGIYSAVRRVAKANKKLKDSL